MNLQSNWPEKDASRELQGGLVVPVGTLLTQKGPAVRGEGSPKSPALNTPDDDAKRRLV